MIAILERVLKKRRDQIEQARTADRELRLSKLVEEVGGWDYFHLWAQATRWKWEQELKETLEGRGRPKAWGPAPKK